MKGGEGVERTKKGPRVQWTLTLPTRLMISGSVHELVNYRSSHVQVNLASQYIELNDRLNEKGHME